MIYLDQKWRKHENNILKMSNYSKNKLWKVKKKKMHMIQCLIFIEI